MNFYEGKFLPIFSTHNKHVDGRQFPEQQNKEKNFLIHLYTDFFEMLSFICH